MAQIVKYYINSILQPYTPSVPSPTSELVLSAVGLIGQADPVDSTEQYYEFWTTVKTQTEILASLNAVILENEIVLTDALGNYLTSDAGVYLYA